MAAHAPDCSNSLNSTSRRGGKRLTMVVMFVVEFCWLSTVLSVLFHCREPTEREYFDPAQKFFVTTRTQILVKLNRITPIWVRAGTKTSHTVGFYGRNSTRTPPQTSSPWWAVCPSYGVNLMNRPNPMHGRPSAGVGQGCCCGVLYKSIN